MSSHLPALPSFVTQLFKSLSALPRASGLDTAISEPLPVAPSAGQGHDSANYNPLTDAPEAVRKVLLSLHVLFPNEFLPALDLLDRRLVTRFRIVGGSDAEVRNAALSKEPCPSVVPANRGGDAAENAQSDPSPRTEVLNSMGSRPTSTSTAAATAGAIGTAAEDFEMRDADPETLVPQQQENDIPRPTHPGNHKGTSTRDPYNTIYYVRSAQQCASRFSTSYDSTTYYQVRLHAWNCSCPAFAFSSFPPTHYEPPLLSIDLAHLDDQTDPGPGVEDQHDWRFGGVTLGDAMPGVCKHILACTLAEHCALFSHFAEERDVSVQEAAGWAAGWGD